ncbi:MAG: DNA polymerase III subunit gamma/tau [bacterium]
MGFLTLYRKYRPQDFNDLVGQEYIVRTLRNALQHERIGHAYLFAGPRGTGKTSTAKVFARALNCQDDSSLEPCGECEPCRKIASGQSIDVVEIDAASNRGVDEIRELREKVRFYPGEGGYKVYIIDEVHMLTKEAFNALLKTLEEPPESVVFILATTEPHKVITTIHSRCQRFDFSLLSVSDIQERLSYICENEDVEYEKKALNTIAHSSNGGLRDAISILDQAISYTNGHITEDMLTKMLGRVDNEFLRKFTVQLAEGKTGKALGMINDFMERGKGVSRFVSDLIDHCRQLLLIKECGSGAGILDFTGETLNSLEDESENVSSSVLIKIIDMLTEVEQKIKFSNQPRLILEMGVIKITSSGDQDSSVEDLRKRVNRLEQSGNLQKASVKQEVTDKKKEFQKTKEEMQKEKSGSREKRQNKKSGSRQEKEVQQKSKEKQSSTRKSGKARKQKTKNDSPDRRNSGKSSQKNSGTAKKSEKESPQSSLTVEDVRNKWKQVLNSLGQEDIKVRAFLREGKPVEVKNNVVVVQFPEKNKFHKKGAEENHKIITRIIKQVISPECQVKFSLAGQEAKQDSAKSSSHSGSGKDKKKPENDDSDSDLLQEVADMFSGEVIEIDENHLTN